MFSCFHVFMFSKYENMKRYMFSCFHVFMLSCVDTYMFDVYAPMFY